MSMRMTPKEFRTWIQQELGIKEPPSEAKLSKFCKGKLATIWKQLVTGYCSLETREHLQSSLFHPSLKSSFGQDEQTETNIIEVKRKINDAKEQELCKEVERKKNILMQHEYDFCKLQQEIQLCHGRKLLIYSTLEEMSLFSSTLGAALNELEDVLHQYCSLEQMSHSRQSADEYISEFKSELSSKMTSDIENQLAAIQEATESMSRKNLVTMLSEERNEKPLMHWFKQNAFQQMVDDNFHNVNDQLSHLTENLGISLHWLQILFLEMCLKCNSSHRNVKQTKIPLSENGLNCLSTDEDCEQTRATLPECEIADIKKIMKTIGSDQDYTLNSRDKALQESLSQVLELCDELGKEENQLHAVQLETTDICETIKYSLEDCKKTDKISHLFEMLREVQTLMKELDDSWRNNFGEILSQTELSYPFVGNTVPFLTKMEDNENNSSILRSDDEFLENVLFDNSNKETVKRGNSYHSCSGHSLLENLVEAQTTRDLSNCSLRARVYGAKLLEELLKEYNLKDMCEQLTVLQGYWLERVSECGRDIINQLNTVSNLLPKVRDLLDEWKEKPGLALRPDKL